MKKLLSWLAVLAITLSVSPRVGFTPLKVKILVRHTPKAEDRTLILAISCDGLDPEISETPLDGANADGQHWFTRTLSGCDSFIIGAGIERADGTLEVAQSVQITPSKVE